MSDLIDDASEGANAHEYTVSELSGAVKRVIEEGFGHVRVRAEVGRVSRPRSGHVYLDLKDDKAVLNGIIWKGIAQSLRIQPEEGMEVVATGRMTTFPGQSRYQLIIERIAPAGVGALMAQLEKLKAKLGAEGLFAEDRKKAPPFLPEVIGVVTSPSGAVIRDILHRLADRFPRQVLLWPVAVQGEKCAAEVSAAIRGFNALPEGGPVPRPDVIIVARGGGSVEDLWGFNEEPVVRAAAESAIPLISAVGHETDTTLIDFAADRRAPTPTAAAEMAVPVRSELLATLAALEDRRAGAMARGLSDRRQRLRDLSRALPKPEQILAERRQRLDGAGERLPLALRALTTRRRVGLERVGARLSPGLLRRRTEVMAAKLAGLSVRLEPKRLIELPKRRDRLAGLARVLESLSYRGALERGFAVVRSDGAVIPRAAGVRQGAALEIEFADGKVDARASGDGPHMPRPKRKPAPKNSEGDEGQGSLF